MPQIAFVSPEEHAIALERIDRLERLLEAYVTNEDRWLDTDAALKCSGIKARSTLVQFARASAPGVTEEGRITYRKEGTKCLYSQASCISHRQRRHGQPALVA
jgi:hypothetical protein